MVDGVRLMFSYPTSDYFANVKVEQLPAAKYPQEKHDIIGEFEKILASGSETGRNYDLKPRSTASRSPVRTADSWKAQQLASTCCSTTHGMSSRRCTS